MSSWVLDPRFRVVAVGGHAVIELASGAPAAPASAKGGKPAAGAGAPAAGAPPRKEKTKEDKPAGDVVLGVDGKPLSKKDLRILERQRKEVCDSLSAVVCLA